MAACRAHDVNIFYAAEHETASIHRAKRICDTCPVRTICRDHAIAANEPHGIWGGLTPGERIRYLWRESSRNV
ncbi:WhiB family transcriptional regulator [Nocardia cyriacigeorgica]|uniref:WhiB family transcriptional regulator n=1 Tax=Nocardia cyriacigeorgica TaxID=135487 RepID=UPI001C49C848|nr:WhiB family transcriptional regulator [Nocardia cyriacigeorgica]